MITKQFLRQQALERRKKIPLELKLKLDNKIFENLKNLKDFSNANLVLTYLSTDLEIDTKEIIEFALKQGKTVAIPHCNEQNELDFYKILNFDGLIKTKMGIIEPVANLQNKIVDFTSSICITPGLIFDKLGYRIGYGKGFYDKFFKNYHHKCVGLCYNENVADEIPHDEHDKPVDVIVTQSEILNKIN